MSATASLDLSARAPHGWLAALAGVYDGHGGDEAAQLVASALPAAITDGLPSHGGACVQTE